MLNLLKLSKKDILTKSSITSKPFTKKLSIPLPMKDLHLHERDPELFDIIEKEKRRQFAGLELIASENYTSTSVMECLGIYLNIYKLN